MPGPTGVTAAAPVPAQQPPPATIGVIAENTFSGPAAGWEVKEFIDLDEDETSPGVFSVEESHQSGWLPATIGHDEHRIDQHLISTSVIDFSKMAKDGTEYMCVFTQVFKKRPIGGNDSERLPNSGFRVTHTVTWRQNQWEYFTQKAGAQIYETAAGAGTVRYPAAGWARVPI